ncbi:MAG: alanine racemase [Myxococcota bacterium]|nr:alanine racemase [Myxococcota bacterium]
MSEPIPRFRPTRARVDLEALRHNCRVVLQRVAPSGATVMAAVKADAYGHGLVPVSRILVAEGVAWLGVAIVEEGLRLRRAGIDTPILVLGGILDGAEEVSVEAGLTPVVYRQRSIEALAAIAGARGEVLDVHLKVDTGMNRLGVPLAELDDFLRRIEALGNLRIDGVLTHLAEAERSEGGMTEAQIRAFEGAVSDIRARGHQPRWVHAANSAALLTGRRLDDGPAQTLVRPGILLYGCAPDPALEEAWPLKPVLSFETAVSFLKEVPAGSRLSYGATWEAQRPSRIATLPVGYGDGYVRALGNRAEVLVRGRRAPVVGRVCMDLVLADVTDIPGVEEGDPVVLLGPQGEEEITAAELAGLLETIPYEVICSISPRVPRSYQGGEE